MNHSLILRSALILSTSLLLLSCDGKKQENAVKTTTVGSYKVEFKTIPANPAAGRKAVLEARVFDEIEGKFVTDAKVSFSLKRADIQDHQHSGAGTIKVSKEIQRLIDLKIEEVRTGTAKASHVTSGRIITKPGSHAYITTLKPGRIIHDKGIPFARTGETVRKGQSLCVLENLDFTIKEGVEIDSEIVRIEAERSKSETALKIAEDQYKRTKRLYEGGVVSKNVLEESELKRSHLQHDLRRMEREIEILSASKNKSEVNRIVLKSPISGVVTESKVVIGEIADAGKVLYEIVDLSTLWVEADIYEGAISKVRKARGIIFSVPSYPEEIFKGKPVYIGSDVNKETRVVRAVFEVRNERGLLKPGMSAQVSFETGEKLLTPVVPVEAVLKDGAKRFVYIQTGDEEFARREIKTGAEDIKYIEVIDGLKAGEKVVTRGAYLLKAEEQKASSKVGDDSHAGHQH